MINMPRRNMTPTAKIFLTDPLLPSRSVARSEAELALRMVEGL
jgi:hypothetical protein